MGPFLLVHSSFGLGRSEVKRVILAIILLRLRLRIWLLFLDFVEERAQTVLLGRRRHGHSLSHAWSCATELVTHHVWLLLLLGHPHCTTHLALASTGLQHHVVHLLHHHLHLLLHLLDHLGVLLLRLSTSHLLHPLLHHLHLLLHHLNLLRVTTLATHSLSACTLWHSSHWGSSRTLGHTHTWLHHTRLLSWSWLLCSHQLLERIVHILSLGLHHLRLEASLIRDET